MRIEKEMKQLQIRSAHVLLWLMIGISIIVRGLLIVRGGQFFFPDESRYLVSRTVAEHLLGGNLKTAIAAITGVDHLGFKIMGIIPALTEALIGETPFIPAFFFSLFNVASLLIVWLLSLRLGADRNEALWAVFFLASSNAFFYYSSHLIPYDLALALGLFGFYIGVCSKSRPLITALAGFFAFLTFVTYNGYWILAVLVILSPSLLTDKPHSRWIIKPLLAASGFLFPLFSIVLLGKLLIGKNLIESYLSFSGNIVQGAFSEGHTLPFAYLWEAEKFLSIVWLSFIIYSVILLRKARPQRIIIWLGALVFIYGNLVIFSVFLNKFVVYGRLVRQMIPFIALSSAFALRILEYKIQNRYFAPCVVAAVLIIAGINFRSPLLLTYPIEFERRAHGLHSDFELPREMMSYMSPDKVEVGSYTSYYIKYIYPFPKEHIPSQGQIVMRASHPQRYKPYLYEGFTPERRAIFQSTQFDMLIIRNDE